MWCANTTLILLSIMGEIEHATPNEPEPTGNNLHNRTGSEKVLELLHTSVKKFFICTIFESYISLIGGTRDKICAKSHSIHSGRLTCPENIPVALLVTH